MTIIADFFSRCWKILVEPAMNAIFADSTALNTNTEPNDYWLVEVLTDSGDLVRSTDSFPCNSMFTDQLGALHQMIRLHCLFQSVPQLPRNSGHRKFPEFCFQSTHLQTGHPKLQDRTIR